MRVGDIHGLVEFGGNVQHSVGAELYPMGAHGANFDLADNSLLVEVDDFYGAAIGTGLSNARVSIDGQVGQTAVGRNGHLVRAHSVGFHFADLDASLGFSPPQDARANSVSVTGLLEMASI